MPVHPVAVHHADHPQSGHLGEVFDRDVVVLVLFPHLWDEAFQSLNRNSLYDVFLLWRLLPEFGFHVFRFLSQLLRCVERATRRWELDMVS